jgi:2-dehydro-3-deoxyphosphogluconate aldolase/(4S)-4-hydroxy-2-oxoglutarate aldolase
VLTIARVEDAVPLAEALVAGGLAALEITLRTDAAARAARAIVNDVPGRNRRRRHGAECA